MPREDFKFKLVNGVEVALSTTEVDTLVANELAHNAKVADYLANHKYKDDRRNGTFDDSGKRLTDGYPEIGDQLDALWKGGEDQTAMKAKIDKVKADHPKGDS